MVTVSGGWKVIKASESGGFKLDLKQFLKIVKIKAGGRGGAGLKKRLRQGPMAFPAPDPPPRPPEIAKSILKFMWNLKGPWKPKTILKRRIYLDCLHLLISKLITKLELSQ